MSDSLCSPRVVAALLQEYGLKPNKRLGQHFLIDANVVERVAEAAGAAPGESILEVGAGLGCLTEALARRGARVLAVEIDRGLVKVLHRELGRWPGVQVIEGDVLKLNLAPWLQDAGTSTVAGNLPYVITSPLLIRFLEEYPQVRRIVVMVQLEVARRLTASPGTRDYGPLRLRVEYHARAEILRTISPAVFLPPPEVESALVRLSRRETPAVEAPDSRWLFAVIRAAFAQRRKTLRNSLFGGFGGQISLPVLEGALSRAGLDPQQRPQQLTLDDYARLARCLEQPGGSSAPEGLRQNSGEL